MLISSLADMLVQRMCARLGIARRFVLAQVTRAMSSRKVAVMLWIVCELSIVLWDIPEVIVCGIVFELCCHIL
ncbi:divalent metal cation transporter [Staphylococcus pseudintermedius]|uniref:divalent metal cation transporter n=1 Tax=Staphylococcus pseudintermedius TaxID=283734 RepID=UPI002286E928|nr:divalent metal cation transporter [Staphylococcus pseudintermedius]